MLKKIFSAPVLFCIAIFLALPVCVSYQVLDSFVTPRIILISATALLLILVFFFKAQAEPVLLNRIPVLALVVFLALEAISISKSINPGDAWYEWMKSFLFLPIMLLTAVLFTRQENRITLLKFSQVCVPVLSAVYCYQWIYFLNHQKLDLVFDLKIHIASTLGNKNFYAEVICLLFPFSCIAFFTLDKWWKSLSALNLLLLVISFGLTQSFAVFAAFGVASCFVLAAWYFSGTARKFRGYQVAGIVLLAAFVFGFAMLKSGVIKSFDQRVETIQRYLQNPGLIDSTMKANNNSTFERIMLWRNTLELSKENPVTGCGANNWKLLYPKSGIGGTRYIDGGNVHYEHPHNDYLLIAAEAGIPAALIFLFFLCSLIGVSFREMKYKPDSKLWFAAIMFAVICFAIVSIFSFPRMRFYGWILLGVYAGMFFSFDEVKKINGDKKKLTGWKMVLLLCAVVSAWSVTASVTRFTGEVHSKQLQLAKKQMNFARIIRESEKATSWYFPIDETATPFTWYKGMALFYGGYVQQAREAYEDALKKNPYHIQLLNDLATACEQTNERERAIELYQRAISVTPRFPHSLLNISACYFNLGKKDSAFIYLDRVYGIKLSGQEKKSYDVYLPAILREKIYTDSAYFAEGSRPQVLKTATDTAFVDSIYRLSKAKNIDFRQALEHAIQKR